MSEKSINFVADYQHTANSDMRKKLLTLAIALITFALPSMAIVNGRSLNTTLKDLNEELLNNYRQSTEAQMRFKGEYARQRQKMIDIIKESNELSILLYTQELNLTFDMTYALKKVTTDYKDFSKDRRPYDRIVGDLDYEIERYARLIEALRRLPPMLQEVQIDMIPDSLLYHNDSLDQHLYQMSSSLEREIIQFANKDTSAAPFILDAEGERNRDSCIIYASRLLKMYAFNRTRVITDSTHYQEAYLRMQETYDYATARYQELEKYVFYDGQTSYLEILASPRSYWNKTKVNLRNQYDFSEMIRNDSIKTEAAETAALADTSSVASVFPAVKTEQEKEQEAQTYYDGMSRKGINAFLVFAIAIQIITLILVWGLIFLILWLIRRFAKPKRFVSKKQLPIFSILVGTFLYFLAFGYFWGGGEYVQMGVKHVNTFLWLLIVIFGSLLLRVNSDKLRYAVPLYTPAIAVALFIIVCRIIFIPDRLLTILFPPLLLLVVLRQLAFCIRESGRATTVDITLGWLSLAIYMAGFAYSFFGYTFVALLILVWWYFQLAILLSIACIFHLLAAYKERRLDRRVNAMRNRINYVSGPDRESLLFGATWLYELVQQVAIPAMLVLSLPMCVHLSLNIFDFNDLYTKFYHDPFVLLQDKDSFETLRISCESIVRLLILFFIVRYINRAVHAIWQYARYAAFMRKNKRTTIRANEINLSLGNSIISVIVWLSYITVVVVVWKVPVGSLSLVAGGLSAGIGLAMKDILNNFIYGIQLMGGRLRVGDWIECDGVRGHVVAINYQCVQMETEDGTEMSFLNESLFGKSFINLTRNNSYEKTTISVGVAYGTDVQKVREVLVEAMQVMCTKDKYGREVVDPKHGIYVVVGAMSDSSVDVAVKQYVLVAERLGYVDRAKEVIYNALNNAGITIPFPQCDVHLIKE